MDDLKPLGQQMTDELITALGGAEGIDGYGKAALAGEGGELEHTALWHVPGGYSMRERLGEAKAIVPSAMKVGGPGTPIDIPLGAHHALGNDTDRPVIVIEVQMGSYFGEDDIVRVSDPYNR